MTPPLVSVVLPIYNAEKYLNEALQSILEQTFKAFELILIDDGSQDSSLQILKSCVDSRIRIIQNPQNRGLIETLNLAFKEARGKYIARMDADDVSMLDRLQVQFEFLEAHPEIAVLGSSAITIDSEGQPHGTLKAPTNPLEQALGVFLGEIPIHPSVMIRREALALDERVFDPQFKHAEDFELWLRLLKKGQISNIAKPLLKYRIHDQSVSQKFREVQLAKSYQAIALHYPAVLEQVPARHFYAIFQGQILNAEEMDAFSRYILNLKKVFRSYPIEIFIIRYMIRCIRGASTERSAEKTIEKILLLKRLANHLNWRTLGKGFLPLLARKLFQ